MKLKKGKLISIRWSDIPREYWMPIVLMKPAQYLKYMIPNKGTYVGYKAFYTNIKPPRPFILVIPYGKFKRAVQATQPENRKEPDKPIFLKLKKGQHGQMWIKDMKPYTGPMPQ